MLLALPVQSQKKILGLSDWRGRTAAALAAAIREMKTVEERIFCVFGKMLFANVICFLIKISFEGR